MIGRSGERGSGISVLAAQHHDDDDLMLILFSANFSCIFQEKYFKI